MEQSIGLRTLERWHAIFKEGGMPALAGSEPPPRPRKIPLELVSLISGLALVKPPLSTAAIARKANRAATDRGWPAVSYSTVRTVTKGLDPGMRTLPIRVRRPTGTSTNSSGGAVPVGPMPIGRPTTPNWTS
ncbi:helix-turn-helix domain-containing protein [Arthrobacter sp. Hiyo1]|uniref:helix-turn-helix domain-containing protein n=1 Tax=Arthrobacter sp. Hiyo1 TaxID=1588020 RepID=UPI00209C47C2|nr:helix-turn-helix domain-containing protein [Arthrobacter sp. Hiyo1]